MVTLTRDDGTYTLANPRFVLDWAWEKYLAFESSLYDHGGTYYLGTTRLEDDQTNQVTNSPPPIYKATLSSSKPEAAAFAKSLRVIAGRLWNLQRVFEALLSRQDNTEKGQNNLEEKYQQLSRTLQVDMPPSSLVVHDLLR